MTTASYSYQNFLQQPNRATIIHVEVDGAYKPLYQRDADPQAPAGGASGSVKDLAQWMTMVLAGGKVGDTQVIDPTVLQQGITPSDRLNGRATVADARSRFYGYGVNVDVTSTGHMKWSHSGAFYIGAATAYAMLPAADVGIVALTNAAPVGAPEAVTTTFTDLVRTGTVERDWLTYFGNQFATLFTNRSVVAGPPPASPKPARPLTDYVGTYSNAYLGDVTVAESGGALRVTLGPENLSAPLTHYDGDVFSWLTPGQTHDPVSAVTFGGSASGSTTAMNIEAVHILHLTHSTTPSHPCPGPRAPGVHHLLTSVPQRVRAPKVDIAGGGASTCRYRGGRRRPGLARRHGPRCRGVVDRAPRRGSGDRSSSGAVRPLRVDQPLGLLAAHPGHGGRDDLVALVDGTPADELRRRRRGAPRTDAGAPRRRGASRRPGRRPDRGARAQQGSRRSGNAPRRDDVGPRSSDHALKATLLRLLDAWPDLPMSGGQASARHARGRLREIGPEALLAEVTPGIRYGPEVLGRVRLVGSALVEPILISVDQPELTVIVHPPLGVDGMADAARSLRDQGNAVGDETRVLVLHELRAGPDPGRPVRHPRPPAYTPARITSRCCALPASSSSRSRPRAQRLPDGPSGFHRLGRAARGFVLE